MKKIILPIALTLLVGCSSGTTGDSSDASVSATSTPEVVEEVAFVNENLNAIDGVNAKELYDELLKNGSKFGLYDNNEYTDSSSYYHIGEAEFKNDYELCIAISFTSQQEVEAVIVYSTADLASYVAKTLGVESVDTYTLSEDSERMILQEQGVSVDDFLQNLDTENSSDAVESNLLGNYHDITIGFSKGNDYDAYVFMEANIEEYLD